MEKNTKLVYVGIIVLVVVIVGAVAYAYHASKNGGVLPEGTSLEGSTTTSSANGTDTTGSSATKPAAKPSATQPKDTAPQYQLSVVVLTHTASYAYKVHVLDEEGGKPAGNIDLVGGIAGAELVVGKKYDVQVRYNASTDNYTILSGREQ